MSYEFVNTGISATAAEKLTNDVLMQGIPMSTFASEVDTVFEFGADDGDTISVSKRQASKRNTRATIGEDEAVGRRKIKFPKTTVLVTEAASGIELTRKEKVLSQGFVKPSYVEDLAIEERQDANAGAFAEFAKAEYTYGSNADTTTVDFNTDSSVPTTTSGLNKVIFRDVINRMVKEQIPKHANGMYKAILSTDANDGIYTDVEAIAQYTQPEFRKDNVVGVYYGCEIMTENEHLANDVDANTKGEAIFFGKDAVLEAVAESTTTGLYINDVADRERVLWWYNIKGYKKTWSYDTDGAVLAANGGDRKGTERIIYYNKQA